MADTSDLVHRAVARLQVRIGRTVRDLQIFPHEDVFVHYATLQVPPEPDGFYHYNAFQQLVYFGAVFVLSPWQW